ncbi:MAG TPA: CoA transferase, partial [Acidimicrobiales bacterium]|nr:CoA transferase [Acidimicrobiales bacterium]
MAGALTGLRVLDLTVGVAGPVAGMMLADNGAEVAKVEPPGGDPARGRPGFQVWNRGKRARRLDPAVEADRAGLAGLHGSADLVLVGTHGPGHTWEDLRSWGLAPGAPATWVVLPPYLLGETPWVGGGESAGLLLAHLGHAWAQASHEDRPVDCVHPVPLYLQGLWAATVAVAAVLARIQGRPTWDLVAVGGAHGALLASPGGFGGRPGAPRVHRPGGPGGALPNYRCYRCGDGTWVFLGAFTEAFIRRGFRALGAGHLLEDDRLGGDPASVRRPENTAWLTEALAERFLQRTRGEWLAVLEAADVPAAPVLDRDGWLDHPQVRALGLRLELADHLGRPTVMPGLPVQLAATPGAVAAPAPGVPDGIGETPLPWPDRPARPRPAGASRRPLEGTRVLDLGTIIAGPYVATLLGELGADVVKVERPPRGDEYRVAHGGRGESGFGVYNRGQRSLVLDLADAAGRAAFGELAGGADVVVDNYRPGVADRLGISWDDLARAHPGATTVSISAFGDLGPLGGRAGFDPLVQAMSGMMRAQGGPTEEETPAFLTMPVNDVVSAALGAFGACASLVARERLGAGQRVTVALTAAACLLQADDLVRCPGRPPAVVGGPDFPGPTPLCRLYPAGDGWVRLEGAWPGDLARLAEAGLLDPGLVGPGVPPEPPVIADVA